MKRSLILGVPIASSCYSEVVSRVAEWVLEGSSRAVSICTVHSLVTSRQNGDLRSALLASDICTSDGVPLVWVLRSRGLPESERVYGPTLMLRLLAEAEKRGWRVALYGGHEDRMPKLIDRLQEQFPELQIVESISPPFRKPSREEAETYRQRLQAAKPDLLFVGIGCPKQEIWIAEHRDSIPAVMLGVGAAFDFHAGAVRQAPGWMQGAGLEWLFRLLMEPRRLFRRYLVTNSLFLYHITLEQIRYLKQPRKFLV